MSPSLDQARVALAAQPFSRLLGAQLNTFGPDGVELEVPARPEHRQPHRFAHGGLLGYAADDALTFAAGAVAGPGVLTAGYTSNVLAPVLGDRLLTRAWVVSAGQRPIVTRCELLEPHPDHDRLCAIAQGAIARTTWSAPALLATTGRGGRSCPAPAHGLDLLVDGGNRNDRAP